MKILTEQMKAKDLKPGDLFSSEGASYWDNFHHQPSIGEKVYVRTDTPCPAAQEEEVIYKLTIQI